MNTTLGVGLTLLCVFKGAEKVTEESVAEGSTDLFRKFS